MRQKNSGRPTFFGPRVPGEVSALQEKEAAREALKEAVAKPEMSRPWPWKIPMEKQPWAMAKAVLQR